MQTGASHWALVTRLAPGYWYLLEAPDRKQHKKKKSIPSSLIYSGFRLRLVLLYETKTNRTTPRPAKRTEPNAASFSGCYLKRRRTEFAIPPYRYTAMPSYLHTVIPSSRHTVIPPYRHTAIPSCRHTFIPPCRHTFIPSHRHTAIQPYRHRS